MDQLRNTFKEMVRIKWGCVVVTDLSEPVQLSIFSMFPFVYITIFVLFQGLFKPSVTFFTLCIVQLVALEIFAYWVMSTYGTGWIPYLVALTALGTLQVRQYAESNNRTQMCCVILCKYVWIFLGLEVFLSFRLKLAGFSMIMVISVCSSPHFGIMHFISTQWTWQRELRQLGGITCTTSIMQSPMWSVNTSSLYYTLSCHLLKLLVLNVFQWYQWFIFT